MTSIHFGHGNHNIPAFSGKQHVHFGHAQPLHFGHATEPAGDTVHFGHGNSGPNKQKVIAAKKRAYARSGFKGTMTFDAWVEAGQPYKDGKRTVYPKSTKTTDQNKLR